MYEGMNVCMYEWKDGRMDLEYGLVVFRVLGD